MTTNGNPRQTNNQNVYSDEDVEQQQEENGGSPRYVTSQAQIREEQGYGVESVIEGQQQQQENGGGVLRTESIPTEWDLYLQEFVDKPSKGLRYMSIFSMIFGSAMSILSLVNAIQNIAEGKGG